MIKKGIILAGGMGTRMSPLTKAVNKQLLPIHDKPLIFYPLSILMLAKIRDILIIVNKGQLNQYKKLIPNGERLGMKINYIEQDKPRGLPDAFILGENFIKDDDVCLILGDNIFYGKDLPKLLKQSVDKVQNNDQSIVFGYNVSDPERYGVVEFDVDDNVISLEEKPSKPKSNFAVVGLYFYKNDVVKIAKNITPSKRGELEITSVNNEYLRQNRLAVEVMSRGYAWLDTGTHDSLLEAANFIKTLESRQGLKISCLEEIAFKYGYIDKAQIINIANSYNNEYGQYLMSLIDD